MNSYNKGVVFSMEVNHKEELFSVIANTKIDDAEYILAVPVNQNGDEAVPVLDGVVAFRVFEDETLSVETDGEIVSQIVDNIL